MKLTTAFSSALFAAMLSVTPAAFAVDDTDVLYQVSTIGSLMEGGYDGQLTISELGEHGGFGLGTFDRLDGEMVVLDGVCYQVRADGQAYVADGAMTTPFAAVTFFEPDMTGRLGKGADLDALKKYIDGMLPDDGLIYAVKVSGSFSYVHTRSVRAQEKPYPRLADAVRDQPEVMRKDVKGTLAGFRMPGYVGGGLNVPGYHFHFLDEAGKTGGHVLGCGVEDAVVEADATTGYYVKLPEGGAGMHSAHGVDADKELDTVEGR